MTDIHSHVIYGADDGPVTLEDSLAMLRMAYKDGINTVIATPHHNDVYRIEPEIVLERADIIRGRLKRENIEINLFTGNECRLDERLLGDLLCGRCLTLAGSRYVLIEISPFLSTGAVKAMLSDILRNNYIPIVAHCERLVGTKQDINRIRGLKEMGCLLQMNADTVLENKRGWFRQWVLSVISDGSVSFICSDAHGTAKRKPLLKKAYAAVAKCIGNDAAEHVFRLNALNIFDT